MLIHIFTKLGKLHCVNADGLVVLSSDMIYIEHDDLEFIKHEEPCCIVFDDNRGHRHTLYGCTMEGQKIRYAKAFTGRSDK